MIGTGAALLIAAAGIATAVVALHGGPAPTTTGPANQRAFQALWPEQTLAAVRAVQRQANGGDHALAWRTSAPAVALRFARQVLGWTPVSASGIPTCHDPGPCPRAHGTVHTLKVACGGCPSESITVRQILRHGNGGIWSVVRVESGGLTLLLPESGSIHAGDSIGMLTHVPSGQQLDVGYTYLGPCGRLTWFSGPTASGHTISAVVNDYGYPANCAPGASPMGQAQAATDSTGQPLPLTEPIDGYVFAYLGPVGARAVDPLSETPPAPIGVLSVAPIRFLPAVSAAGMNAG